MDTGLSTLIVGKTVISYYTLRVNLEMRKLRNQYILINLYLDGHGKMKKLIEADKSFTRKQDFPKSIN